MSRKKNKLECKLKRDRARYILMIRILEEKKRESHCGQREEKTLTEDREHEERKREKEKKNNFDKDDWKRLNLGENANRIVKGDKLNDIYRIDFGKDEKAGTRVDRQEESGKKKEITRCQFKAGKT